MLFISILITAVGKAFPRIYTPALRVNGQRALRETTTLSLDLHSAPPLNKEINRRITQIGWVEKDTGRGSQGNRERCDRFVKNVTLSEVPADYCGFPGTGVSARQGRAAEFSELDHLRRIELFNLELDFHILELADIVVTELGFRPAKENITRRLHKPMAHYHALSVIGVNALPRIGFQNRRTCLLDLEKKRIPCACHHQNHKAERANACS
jgi:hypothetical protein